MVALLPETRILFFIILRKKRPVNFTPVLFKLRYKRILEMCFVWVI